MATGTRMTQEEATVERPSQSTDQLPDDEAVAMLAKWFTFTWQFGVVLCKLVHYMQNVSVICSVLTLMAISLERHYAIVHPMRAKYICTTQQARKLTVCLWFMSFTLAVPILFGQVHKQVGEARKAYWCIKEWGSPWQSRLYEMSTLVLVFLIPLTVMSVAYIRICREMWHVTSKRAAMRAGKQNKRSCSPKDVSPAGSEETREFVVATFKYRRVKPMKEDVVTRKQVIKMLVAILVLFAVCWGPFLLDNVLVAFDVTSQLHYGHLKPMRQAFALMSYANSCLNPIVYAFMSKNFRHSFQTAFMSIVRRSGRYGNNRPRQGSFQTRPSCSSAPPSSRRTSRTDVDIVIDLKESSTVTPRYLTVEPYTTYKNNTPSL